MSARKAPWQLLFAAAFVTACSSSSGGDGGDGGGVSDGGPGGSTDAPAPDSGTVTAEPTDPTITDTAACAKIVPAGGDYSLKATSPIPTCFQTKMLSGWFEGASGFANRGTAVKSVVQFNSDDLCLSDARGCSIKSSCDVFLSVQSVGEPGHVDFVGVWQDEKHFTGTISLFLPRLACIGKVAVSGSALF